MKQRLALYLIGTVDFLGDIVHRRGNRETALQELQCHRDIYDGHIRRKQQQHITQQKPERAQPQQESERGTFAQIVEKYHGGQLHKGADRQCNAHAGRRAAHAGNDLVCIGTGNAVGRHEQRISQYQHDKHGISGKQRQISQHFTLLRRRYSGISHRLRRDITEQQRHCGQRQKRQHRQQIDQRCAESFQQETHGKGAHRVKGRADAAPKAVIYRNALVYQRHCHGVEERRQTDHADADDHIHDHRAQKRTAWQPVDQCGDGSEDTEHHRKAAAGKGLAAVGDGRHEGLEYQRRGGQGYCGNNADQRVGAALFSQRH